MEIDSTVEERIDNLLQFEEDALIEQLGIIEEYKKKNDQQVLAKAENYSAIIEADDTMMGIWDEIKDLGKKMWLEAKKQIYHLICDEDSEEREALISALKKDAKTFVIALAPALVSGGVLPATAIILSTLAAKIALKAGQEKICEKLKDAIK